MIAARHYDIDAIDYDYFSLMIRVAMPRDAADDGTC